MSKSNKLTVFHEIVEMGGMSRWKNKEKLEKKN